MNENRKSIIVKEILYWKESRMLPEQYCDYLLALYTEGNRPKEIRKESTKKQRIHINYLFLMLIPIAVFLLYFTELSFILQTALLSILIVLTLGASIYFSKKGINYQIPLIASALLLLLISVEVASSVFVNNVLVLYITLFFNCLIWALCGWRLKLIYFLISGCLGIILIIVSIFI